VSAGTLLVPAVVALVLAVAAQWWAGRAHRAGNVLVVVNASGSALDSIVVGAEPPYANPLAGRIGYVAAHDSARVVLGRHTGDASVRAWRAGRVLADHVVYFGGDSEFELWLSDRGSLGRYRRSGAASGSGAGSGADSGSGAARRSGT
jgi:hypothetical protein